MKYSIDSLSKLTGISAFTLRNWERRYSFLKPKREKNGYRYYEDDDLALVRQISEMLKSGIRIADIVEMIKAGKRLPEVAPRLTSVEAPVNQLREFEPLYESLVASDLDKAEYLIARLGARLSDIQLLDLVYEPMLRKLGESWENGEIKVSHEHLASAFIRHRLIQYLLLYSPAGNGGGPKVLCATPADELHEGGMLLVSAHLKLRGMRIYYLGPNLPVVDILDAARRINPDLICLSLADPEKLDPVIKGLRDMRNKVCLGGRAFEAVDLKKLTKLPGLHFCETGGRAGADFVEALLSAE